MKLLLIEDEAELAQALIHYLRNGDVVCERAASFGEARDKLESFHYDIVLLDIMLPDGSGLDLLELIKEKAPDTGVLVISARDALDDRITGLERGADDYLTKPFQFPELSARIKALYRRRKRQGMQTLEWQEITIIPDTHEVKVHGRPVELTLKEYKLLVFFIENAGRVLTKQSIAEHLWGDHVDFLDSFDFVYQHIKNLRKKLAAAGAGDYIKTIYGLGYKLTEQ